MDRFKVKNPLTIDERRKIQQGLALSLTYSELALHVGRCKSVVLRESKRLGSVANYEPEKAQANFVSKQKLSGIKRGSDLYLKIVKEENLPYDG